MELNDTIEMMTSSDFKERFKAEYYQLKIRAKKLHDMLDKFRTNTLPFRPKCSYEFLFTQWIYMQNYLVVLEEKAKIEGIELDA